MLLAPSSRVRFLLSFALVALALDGCRCGTKGTSNSYGELALVWKDVDGSTKEDRDATYDFGTAYSGDKIPKQLIVKNLGSGPLTLMALNIVDGDPVSIGPDSSMQAGFEIDFNPNVTLNPTEDTSFTMFFTPHSGHAYLSHVTLSAAGVDPTEGPAKITLKGNGQGGSCDFPDVIDFGLVPVGETFPDTITLTNPGAINAGFDLGALMGTDAPAFGVMPTGTVAIPAMSNANVTFTFTPTEKRDYLATMAVHGSGDCPSKTVTLKGTGSDGVLSWSPTDIDFGYVSPSIQADRQVTFLNKSNVPIVLTEVQTSLPTDFLAATNQCPAGFTGPCFTIPGGSVPTPLTVSCKPAGFGPRSANFTFKTFTNPPAGLVTLECYGGGPRIKVDPRPELAYGMVSFFAQSPVPITRKVEVTNVGTKPPNMDVNGNLFLGSLIGGMPGQQPMIEINPLNANTQLSEISITLPSTYDSSKGLEATIGKSVADLQVTLTPATVGMKEANLVIHSNDSTEPTVTLHLTADAESLPPCQLQVAPSSLNFGLVTPPSFKDLPLTLTNLSQTAGDICYLSGIEIAAGSDPAFSIVGGSIGSLELQPGQSSQVVVRSAPPGPVTSNLTNLTGALTFNVNSPSTPMVTVPLAAVVGPSCIVIAPDDLDFGAVKPGCNSQTHTFSVYNVCTTNVIITGFSVQAGAGQPPGGPNCPGSSACPEFFLTQTPAIPMGGLTLAPGSAPITFQAKYAPIDIGPDNGSIAVNAIQSGLNVAYLVNLEGHGDPQGLQTDTFVQDQQPKADVLLTVDDSGSMSDKQANLGSNFTGFIQYALAAGVDWQIGVTTTDDEAPFCPGLGLPCSGGEQGTMVGDMTNPRILTPSTPNVQSLFNSKITGLGTNGSGTEMGFGGSLDALTPPKITNENAGFLRYDAALAIVVVSDAGDQSPQPFSYYYNRFLNIKGFNRASMFSFNAITTCPGSPGPNCMPAGSSCTYDGTNDSTTYQQMAMQTNGVVAEICATNWATNLQQLGKTAFGFRTTFYLTASPDLSGGKTLTVQIDGNPVVQPDWGYDSAANAVVFDPAKTPGPGQTLTVQYYTACL